MKVIQDPQTQEGLGSVATGRGAHIGNNNEYLEPEEKSFPNDLFGSFQVL